MEVSKTPEEDTQFQAMFELEDAQAIWAELDAYRRGQVPADQIARLIEAIGHYTIPVGEARHIGLIFNSFNGRIEEDAFLRMLSGSVPEREEPEAQANGSPEAKKAQATVNQRTAKTAASTQGRSTGKRVGFNQ